MESLGSWLFGLIQSADFYVQAHRDAVALLPLGTGKTWFDVGCGPGLMTRLAAEQGYSVRGFDRDKAMVSSARRRSRGMGGMSFEVADLESVAQFEEKANVVSAASLLFVVPDRRASLARLLNALADGGTLLVIETSAEMARLPWSFSALAYGSGRRLWVLRLWAWARKGSHHVDVAALCPPGYRVSAHPVMRGLATAWTVRRSA